MATHDGARFVEQQLRSILDELGPEDEVIVVDDASGDDTVDRISGLADPRIRILRRQQNCGYVRAFEQALAQARGAHIFLADQDDIWPPGRVGVMREKLQDAAVVAGNVAVLDGPGRIKGPFGERDWRVQPGQERHRLRILAKLAFSDMPYYGSAMAIRSDARDVALPFPASVHELHDAWLVLVGLGLGSVGHVQDRVVLRRIHDANTTGRVRTPWQVLRGRWWFLLMATAAYRRTRRETTFRA